MTRGGAQEEELCAMKVAVLGGTGFVGARLVEVLLLNGIDAVAAVRNPKRPRDIMVDLRDPMTFRVLDPFDYVVDIASADTLALAQYCLVRDKIFLSGTSDHVIVERLLELYGSSGRGLVVLGAGLFPGISNLAAVSATRRVKDVTSIQVGVCLSPLSGAGAGITQLMGDALQRPYLSRVRGKIEVGPSIARGPKLRFSSGRRRMMRAALADTQLLLTSTTVPNLNVFLAIRPVLMTLAFLATPMFVLTSSWFGAMTRWLFRFLRGRVFRVRPTPVEITAEARGSSDVTTIFATTSDGMLATAHALAAVIRIESKRAWGERPTGCLTIDECYSLEEVVETMRELGSDIAVEVHDEVLPASDGGPRAFLTTARHSQVVPRPDRSVGRAMNE